MQSGKIDLSNNGFFKIGSSEPSETTTLIVVGVGRGGTSMCAGVLDALDVYLGENTPAPTFENLDIFQAHMRNDWNRIEQIIANYNQQYPIWGLKLPGMNEDLPALHSRVRNPFYIFIFRDLAAIANRDHVSHDTPLLDSLERAQQNFGKILDFIRQENPKGLVCSYEKALVNKADFVRTIANVHPNLHDADTQRAIDSIKQSPVAYVEGTAFRGEIGYLDHVSPLSITGWAKNESEQPAKLRLFANGEPIGEAIAIQFRQDLLERKVHPTGYCSFCFELDEPLPKDCAIAARFAESGKELRNSPQFT